MGRVYLLGDPIHEPLPLDSLLYLARSSIGSSATEGGEDYIRSWNSVFSLVVVRGVAVDVYELAPKGLWPPGVLELARFTLAAFFLLSHVIP